MTHSHRTLSTIDGRQTSGRKGLAYDWKRVLLEGVDQVETIAIDEDALMELLSATPA